MLNTEQIGQFVNDGFIRIDSVFDKDIAATARKILWKDLGVDPHDPGTWTKPVIRLGMYSQDPFIQAANTDALHSAFDHLVGRGRWIPCRSMGTFPVRFPSTEDPGDTGWHVDASFPGPNSVSYLDWRINLKSKGRGLLMLFLFSDVGVNDAPTKIRVGSHFDVARVLAAAGDEGLSFMELAEKLSALPAREEVLATGKAGTVYLCHPFIVHAAQFHRGKEAKFMAQPPLVLKDDLVLERPNGIYTPLEQSIRLAIKGETPL
jgi:hypothetical protein